MEVGGQHPIPTALSPRNIPDKLGREDWAGTTVSLDECGKEKSSFPH